MSVTYASLRVILEVVVCDEGMCRGGKNVSDIYHLALVVSSLLRNQMTHNACLRYMLFGARYPRNEINFLYWSVALFRFSVIFPHALGLLSQGR